MRMKEAGRGARMLERITVTDIKEILTVFSPKGRAETIENRKSFGLSFCIDGQITYTHNGARIISDRDHAVLLPMGQTYKLYGDQTGSFPVINFTCTEALCDTVVALPLQNAEVYIKDMEKLRALSLFGQNRAEMMSVFYHILHGLSAQGPSVELLRPAIQYLASHYQDPELTNAELAKQCKISEIYFRRIFASCYRTTPRQFLIDLRINKAKQLLSEGAWKINAVASQCGFSNPYHFSRVFKEKTGLTPTEYWKRYRVCRI